ncbi:hypothetical protein [Nocardiopsis sp. CA-288880]|uniref:hypothetical protein n=1 Tax=Nocardiopsis sp. CA-288880 TaxID=3239995 RepID=UPI003D95841C
MIDELTAVHEDAGNFEHIRNQQAPNIVFLEFQQALADHADTRRHHRPTRRNQMPKLDRESALTKAEKFLKTESREWKHHDVEVIRERAFQHGRYLIAPYNTVSFLKTGKMEDSLVGNIPIQVDLTTGTCEFIDIMKVLDYRDMGYPV